MLLKLRGIFKDSKNFNRDDFDFDDLRKEIKNIHVRNTIMENNPLNEIFGSIDFFLTILENEACEDIFNKYKMDEKTVDLFNSFIRTYSYYTSSISEFPELPSNQGKILDIFHHSLRIEDHIENKITNHNIKNDTKSFLQEYYRQLFTFFCSVPDLSEVISSKMYSVLLHKFEDRVNRKNSKKLILFSSQDITFYSLLKSLEHLVPQSLEYDSNEEINFVLYEVDEEFFIAIKHNDTEISLKFCGGKRLCEYEKFKNFIISTIKKEIKTVKYCEENVRMSLNEIKEEM